MSGLLLLAGCTLESACPLPSSTVYSSVRPVTHLPLLRPSRRSPRMHASCATTSQQGPALQSSFETLPVEIVNHILSYLILPRSRLPGLTEAQSSRDFSRETRLIIKIAEDLTTPADNDRWAADLFSNRTNQHPFHTLSLTSRRCNELVESYCGHLVRACNKFNLPFSQYDKYGPKAVWPDMSGIVYRRLWLQHAPRNCIYCYALMDNYPFPLLKRLLTNCEGCFYRQTLVRFRTFQSLFPSTNMPRIWMRLSANTTSHQPLFSHLHSLEAIATPSGFCASTSKPWPYNFTALEPSMMLTRDSTVGHAPSALSPSSRRRTES
jgi:hypothetical protein